MFAGFELGYEGVTFLSIFVELGFVVFIFICHVSDECSSIGVEVPSASEGLCMCYEVAGFNGGVGGKEWGSSDELRRPVYVGVEVPEPRVSEDYSVSS